MPSLLAALLLLPLRAAGDEEKVHGDYTLYQLVDLANKALRGDTSRGRLKMTIVTPKWERTMEVEGWNKGRQMAFIRILAPAKERGNITLRRHNEMWVYLPRVERVVKIPPTMMHSSWQGSDFTYEDIVKADSVVKDYTHTLLETTPVEGHTVYKIEGSPKPDAPVVWGRVLLWVGVYQPQGQPPAVVPLKEEDYSERGELIRTIQLSDVKMLGGKLLPAVMECLPSRKPGQRTRVEYEELEFDMPLGDDFFSQARLQKGMR